MPLWDISVLLELVTVAAVSTHLITQGYIGRLTMCQCSHPLVGVNELLNDAQRTI